MKQKMISLGASALGMLVAVPAWAQEVTTGIVTDYNFNLGDSDPINVIISLTNVLLGLLAIIAVIMILIGGFRWMTAGGNEDKVGEAKKLIVAAIIGLFIIMISWGLSIYAVGIFGDITGTPVV